MTGKFGGSVKSTASSTQYICKSLYHTVESFGISNKPFQINEALTFAPKSVTCSVNISEDGWAWLVLGRRLFVWQASGTQSTLGTTCRELLLPPSDVMHKADLVNVYTNQGNQTVSCIAVSPEGLIRYWASIANEGISVECNANLQGEECSCMLRVAPLGFIVSTTTATLLLVDINNVAGRESVLCKPLSTPSGWLGFGTIGKKVTSLIFGGNSSRVSSKLQPNLIRVLVRGNENSRRLSIAGNAYSEWELFLLAGHTLQKWELVVAEVEQLVYECNLNRVIEENFKQTLWSGALAFEIETWFIDAQLIDATTNLLILAAASNHAISNRLYYAFVTVDVSGNTAPSKLSSFHILKNVDFSAFRHNQAFDSRSINMLYSRQIAYLYNAQSIVSVTVGNNYEEVDTIVLPSDTTILGGAMIKKSPVLFSRVHGFIAIYPSDVTPYDFINNSFADVTDMMETQREEDPSSDVANQKDPCSRLKAAFLFFVSKKIGRCKSVVDSLFPEVPVHTMQVDSVLDLTVVKVVIDLIDDIPARDPRWANLKNSVDSPQPMNNTMSLQILSQLEEKQKALNWFISFLKEMGIWERLGIVSRYSVNVLTSDVLQEQAEKIIVAISIRKWQAKKAEIIESVVKSVIEKRNIKLAGGLNHQDFFYRQVSLMHEAIAALSSYMDDYIHGGHNMNETINTIFDVNSIFLDILSGISDIRLMNETPSPQIPKGLVVERMTWTFYAGNGGIKGDITQQMKSTFKYGIRHLNDLTMKRDLLSQYTFLIGFSLDEWNNYISGLDEKTAKFDIANFDYRRERHDLIKPLSDENEIGHAFALSEKYCEFLILIELCDKTQNDDQLLLYMDKFEDKNFANCLFSWYLREKKFTKLFNQFRENAKHRQALEDFLSDNPSLSALHAIFSEKYDLAGRQLVTLAFSEEDYIERKQSLLGLGKLALLASTDIDATVLERINLEKEICGYQEDLPEGLYEDLGYEYENAKVLTIPELIKAHVCFENVTAAEREYLKALRLLKYVDDEDEKLALKNDIWVSAVLRNEYPVIDFMVSDPIAYIRNLIFFRIIDNIVASGSNDLAELIPPLEGILKEPKLSILHDNSTFQYLMQIGYEYYATKSQ